VPSPSEDAGKHTPRRLLDQVADALLFLYTEVLGSELGSMDDIVRAKKPRRLPVVMSRPGSIGAPALARVSAPARIASSPPLDQPHQRTQHLPEQRKHLRIERPHPAERLRRFPARERFTRRRSSPLKAHLAVLAAGVCAFGDVQRNADERPLEWSPSDGLRALSTDKRGERRRTSSRTTS
jgi:hypothetical protein